MFDIWQVDCEYPPSETGSEHFGWGSWVFDGYEFAHTSTLNWAIFFHHAGIPYEFRSRHFTVESGLGFMTDFYLPRINKFIELESCGALDATTNPQLPLKTPKEQLDYIMDDELNHDVRPTTKVDEYVLWEYERNFGTEANHVEFISTARKYDDLVYAYGFPFAEPKRQTNYILESGFNFLMQFRHCTVCDVVDIANHSVCRFCGQNTTLANSQRIAKGFWACSKAEKDGWRKYQSVCPDAPMSAVETLPKPVSQQLTTTYYKDFSLN